jgi:uncharacterized protein DUF4115/helix-turn-helix protein
MTSVGEILRTERESQGRGIAEIAEELCLTQRYVRALEEDDLKNLPGTFFYKSFVKQYIVVLGMDQKLLLPGIDAVIAAAEPKPLPVAGEGINGIADPSPEFMAERPPIRALDPIVEDGNRRYLPDGRIGVSFVGLVAVLLGCSGVYALWNRAPRAPVTARATQVVSEVNVTVPAPPVAEPVVEQAPLNPATPTVKVITETGSDGVKHVVLNLSATEETWLSITSEGKQIFSGILRPSQTQTLRAAEGAKMKVGNAGGLEVIWNGKAIGPIGPRGQVREVLFTPENFQILGPGQTL